MNRKFSAFLIVALFLTTFAVAPSTAQEEITLTVWDVRTRDADVAIFDQIDAAFMEANPGVTVVRQAFSFEDLQTTLPLALTEESGPDVSQINQGYTVMGPLVEAGLILPLDEYADEYGWWDRYAQVLHRRNMFTEDGAQIAEGNLYGMSIEAEIVGVYYWRDIFEEQGIEIPKTLAEFEAACAQLKAAGVTPIMFGSLDGWPAIHTYSAIQHSLSTVEAIDNFIYRLEGGTFDDEANLEAAKKLVEWVKAGYFPEGFEGMDYDNQTFNGFVNQQAAMWITGSWQTPNLVPQVGEEPVGFFVFPPAEEGKAPLSIGGIGIAYGISAKTKNPDVAAKYIDFLTTPEVAEMVLQLGLLPAVAVDPALLEEGTLTADTVTGWNTISEANAVGHYLDWAVPLDDIVAALQELMAEQITPEEFVAKVEEAYVTSGE